MSSPPRTRVDVVMPIHNEAASIGFVVEELFDRAGDWLDLRLIACEDGSDDGTQEVLARLAGRFPVVVRSRAERLSYGEALRDGLGAAEAEWVLAMDGDGQCDPGDIARLWSARSDAEIVIGDRQPRCDGLGRRAASRAFALVYRAMFGVTVRDPSCPLVLMRRTAVASILADLGRMPFGFWWEFVATAHCRGLEIAEVAIGHRPRRDGRTQVFSPAAMPGLALTQFGGLARLWLATRRADVARRRDALLGRGRHG